jgi:hypothetical protein
MLPVLQNRSNRFKSPAAALDHLNSVIVQRFTVGLRDLEVDRAGRLSHRGLNAIPQLDAVRLTDSSLAHLNNLTDIPTRYASKIEPELHVTSLNDLMHRQVSAVTVFVEADHDDPETRRVTAVLPTGRTGIDHAVILRRVCALGVDAIVVLATGEMDVHFGPAESIEVLSGDWFQIDGTLRNDYWQPGRRFREPMLEVSLFLLRQVCTNGAYARRSLAEKRLMGWASQRQIEEFIDREIGRVLSFPASALPAAATRMAEQMPTNEEHQAITRLVVRFAGKAKAAELLGTAVSWYDHFNVITAAAHHTDSDRDARQLQMEGGRVLDRFLEAA